MPRSMNSPFSDRVRKKLPPWASNSIMVHYSISCSLLWSILLLATVKKQHIGLPRPLVWSKMANPIFLLLKSLFTYEGNQPLSHSERKCNSFTPETEAAWIVCFFLPFSLFPNPFPLPILLERNQWTVCDLCFHRIPSPKLVIDYQRSLSKELPGNDSSTAKN